MFNVLYYQVVTQLCTTLSEVDCIKILNAYGNYEQLGEIRNIGAAMALVLTNLDKCRHFRKDAVDEQMADKTTSDMTSIDLQPYELELQKLCLPFLRVAALLRHHIYHQELPHVASSHLEFARLVYFLELVTVGMDWSDFDASKALCFCENMHLRLPMQWCNQLKDVPPPHHVTRELVLHQHIAWQQPRLLRLPREYERLFTVNIQTNTCVKLLFTRKFYIFFSIITNKCVPNVRQYQRKVLFVCCAERLFVSNKLVAKKMLVVKLSE